VCVVKQAVVGLWHEADDRVTYTAGQAADR
jgi:hypothetical protein